MDAHLLQGTRSPANIQGTPSPDLSTVFRTIQIPGKAQKVKYSIPNTDRSLQTLFRLYRGIKQQETFYHIARTAAHAPIGNRELAAIMEVPVSTISSRISSLIEQGLIKSLPDPKHRRSQLLTLTQAGIDVQNSLVDQVKSHMTPQNIVKQMELNGVTLLDIQVEIARVNHAKQGDDSDES